MMKGSICTKKEKTVKTVRNEGFNKREKGKNSKNHATKRRLVHEKGKNSKNHATKRRLVHEKGKKPKDHAPIPRDAWTKETIALM